MVVPIKGTLAGGMVARLTKLPDGTATGHILHTPAAFMPLGSGPEGSAQVPVVPEAPVVPVVPVGPSRDAEVSARLLDDWTFSFFAQLHMPPDLVRTYGQNDADLHVTTLYDPADGSATRIDDTPGGSPTVTTTGPRDLWQPVEAAHQLWQRLNRPCREWFTIEATPAEQAVRYAAPNGKVHRWTLWANRRPLGYGWCAIPPSPGGKSSPRMFPAVTAPTVSANSFVRRMRAHVMAERDTRRGQRDAWGECPRRSG